MLVAAAAATAWDDGGGICHSVVRWPAGFNPLRSRPLVVAADARASLRANFGVQGTLATTSVLPGVGRDCGDSRPIVRCCNLRPGEGYVTRKEDPSRVCRTARAASFISGR